jgi:hypothetical protein
MKTFYTAAIAVLISTAAISQPCAISNTSITVTNVDAATCQVTFDLTFTANINSGNKHAVVHLWENNSSYPVSITYPASAVATAQAIGTLAIKDPGTSNPTYEPSYSGSGISGGLSSLYLTPTQFLWSGTNSNRTFTFKGLVATISNCAVATAIKGDVWATQNDNNTSGGCINRGSLQFVINEPGMRGLMVCSNPRAFNVSFSTSAITSITFEAYKDVAPFGIFDATDKQIANKLSLTDGSGTSTSKTINNPAQPTNQYTTYGPYSYTGSQFGIWVVARAGSNTYDNILLIENTCSTLPVSFRSFTAVRNKQIVSLKWETTSEENNAGFLVQRKAAADWTDVTFVATKAVSGSSSEVLSYQLTDVNSIKGITQYRIKQIDLDGQSKYSEIRTVQGEAQNIKLLVYPNPATNGKIYVVFDNPTDVYGVELMDVTGRVVKSWKTVSNNLLISDLKVGQYLVKVKNNQTLETITEKIIVSK